MTGENLISRMRQELGAREMRKYQISEDVQQSLNPSLTLRPYQIQAMQNFIAYQRNDFQGKQPASPALLFHMATGSGKTLIMATSILELYKQGYRNFLFFVNSTNIIEKTKENFLNHTSQKFLFNSTVSLDGRYVPIKQVENFNESSANAINIKFTTLQALHMSIAEPKENGITLESLSSEKMVLISDEAHHTNAKKLGRGKVADTTWEETVEALRLVHADNILLEFTATMNFGNSDIAETYRHRLIFDYPLRAFRADGYSKDIEVLQFNSDDLWARALTALISSQYRKLLFQTLDLDVKPVVLFKSNSIENSKNFYGQFIKNVLNLNEEALIRHFKKSNDSLLSTTIAHLEDKEISLSSFAQYIVDDFSPSKTLLIDSMNRVAEHQILLNSLENPTNPIRAVFAVDMLNEGWDVLNLFDIVRLYDTRDPTGNTGVGEAKVGATTMREAQLIGRGARYYPFRLGSGIPADQRKFDSDLENPLRYCEILTYHSAKNPKYIQELNSALQEIGLKSKKSITVSSKLKDDFKEKGLYLKGQIFVNSQIKRDREQAEAMSTYVAGRRQTIRISSNASVRTMAFDENLLVLEDNLHKSVFDASQIITTALKDASLRMPGLAFDKLKAIFPKLTSRLEFLTSKQYLAGIEFELEKPIDLQISELTHIQHRDIAMNLLTWVQDKISKNSEFVGTETFKPRLIGEVFYDKELNFSLDESSDAEFGISIRDKNRTNYYLDIGSKAWVAFEDFHGTSEEKSFLKALSEMFDELPTGSSNYYLLRNDRHFQIYAFNDGRPFEPDFVLVESDANSVLVTRQLFIEPKGLHLFDQDEWKQDFLQTIRTKFKLDLMHENKDVKIWGLPFYNESEKESFIENLQAVISGQN